MSKYTKPIISLKTIKVELHLFFKRTFNKIFTIEMAYIVNKVLFLNKRLINIKTMDDNFSPKVKEVIAYSKEEALRLGHDFIGTEHLMLGLLRDGSGKAINILDAMNVDLELLRRKVEILNPSDHTNTDISQEKKNLHLTRQAERALKTTFLEAKLFQSSSINTAHLLLCILRNENDPTTKLLNKLKVDYDNVKEEFKAMMTQDGDYLDNP